ncbi:MAG TPA: MFS transporter [Steroidobacteraceae bacterium]|nr:MFS transporter [Steroidobacteraceae bacterium]
MAAETDAPPIAAASPPAHALLTRSYLTRLLGVLLALSTLNAADQAILSVLAQPIKEDLQLTDTQLGLLQGLGFAVLWSVLGLPVGWLAERFSRKGLIALCAGVWSLMTTACALSSNFLTLLLCRAGVGIGQAGFLPCSQSLLADHFAANRRGSAMSILLLGMPFGFLLGQSIGGWAAGTWSWRAGFMVLGVPGLLAALVTWRTLHEPPRGLIEGSPASEHNLPFKQVAKEIWSKSSFRHLLVALSISQFSMNAIAQFVLPFYLRGFHLPLAVIGTLFGAISFTSNGLGMLLGGFGFDRLARSDARWLVAGPAAVLVVATPLYWGAFGSTGIGASLACIWCANLLLATYFAPTFAVVQNLVGPRMRATAAGIVGMVTGLLGTGLGPSVLGIASDFFARRAFAGGDFSASCPGGHAAAGAAAALDASCREASMLGLRHALTAILIFFIWAAVHFLLAAKPLKQELYVPAAPGPIRSGG